MNINDIMKVSEVRKIGTFKLIEDKNDPDYERKLDMIYESDLISTKGKRVMYSPFIKEEKSTVYFIVVNDEVYKIGGSGDKSGIKGTLGWYVKVNTSSPGSNRYIVNNLIHKELEKGNTVDFYAVCIPPVVVEASFLGGRKKMVSLVDHKKYESMWIKDFIEANNGKCPIWNFQEFPENKSESYYEAQNEWIKYRDSKKKNVSK